MHECLTLYIQNRRNGSKFNGCIPDVEKLNSIGINNCFERFHLDNKTAKTEIPIELNQIKNTGKNFPFATVTGRTFCAMLIETEQ